MTPVGLVETQPQVVESAPPTTVRLQLRVEDAVASAHRLWVRGRLVGLERWPKKDNDSRWWHRFWSKREGQQAWAEVTLETQVSGTVLRAPVPLQSDGRFEALFQVNFPPARRGWRLARNSVAFADQKLRDYCEREGIAAAALKPNRSWLRGSRRIWSTVWRSKSPRAPRARSPIDWG